MVPEKFIEEIQARVDIVEVVSGYLPLKKTGRNFKACCPFHSEKTPSFVVSPQKQIFHCFGCGQGGGVFQFLMQMEKVNFPEAVEMLAKKLGMAMPQQKSRQGKSKSFCYEAADKASLFYHNNLKSRAKPAALDYLFKRGIAAKTIDTFRLGFAPGGNSLINYMRNNGFTLDALDKTSLVSSRGQGFKDVFSNRIIFPIFDVRDRVIGFGGRTWQGQENSPKYINSGESLIYSKRKALFGLNLAKKAIIKEDYVCVVEGYLDMIIPFMRGIKNIVASLGTSLTQEQVKLIGRFCTKVVLVFDSDKAGQNAMLRTIDLLLENQIQTSIVDLPQGEDPDSIVRKKGKDYFLNLINEAQGFFDYKLKILRRQLESEDIESKSKIAQSMLVTLDKISDQVKKYQYLAKLAQELKVKEEAIISEYKRKFLQQSNFKKNLRDSDSSKEQFLNQALSITEKIVLKALFTNDKVFSLVKKSFKAEDFGHPLAKKAVDFLFANYSKESRLKQKLLTDIKDSAVSGFVSRIILEEDIPQDKDSLKKSLVKFHQRRICQEKEKLKEQIKKADLEGDQKELAKLINRYNKAKSGVKND